jgi:modulator of FtsH protease HflC
MVKSFTILVAAIIGMALLSYMFVFQVRYDEVAVVTTFDKLTAQSLKREAGPYFRWPWPIQRVYPYSRLIRVYEPQQEQVASGGGPKFQLSGDSGSVVVRYYMAWRIDENNPLDFYSSLQDAKEAEKRLEPILREEMGGTLGTYSFSQLVNTDPSKLKLHEIEDKALAKMRERLAGSHYGVKIEQVGIRRIVLPEGNVQAVYNSMTDTRKAMAANARSNGNAVAQQIESNAEMLKQRILAFADRVAQDIRAQGNLEASGYYKVFQENPDLAIELRRLDAARKAFGNNTDIFLESSEIGMQKLTGSPPATQPANRPASGTSAATGG